MNSIHHACIVKDDLVTFPVGWVDSDDQTLRCLDRVSDYGKNPGKIYPWKGVPACNMPPFLMHKIGLAIQSGVNFVPRLEILQAVEEECSEYFYKVQKTPLHTWNPDHGGILVTINRESSEFQEVLSILKKQNLNKCSNQTKRSKLSFLSG